jgi:hypothetical protein
MHKSLRNHFLGETIYAPMIYTAPCVRFLMRADRLRTIVSPVTARADRNTRGLHQAGGGLQAGHHLRGRPEATSHPPLLC